MGNNSLGIAVSQGSGRLSRFANRREVTAAVLPQKRSHPSGLDEQEGGLQRGRNSRLLCVGKASTPKTSRKTAGWLERSQRGAIRMSRCLKTRPLKKDGRNWGFLAERREDWEHSWLLKRTEWPVSLPITELHPSLAQELDYLAKRIQIRFLGKKASEAKGEEITGKDCLGSLCDRLLLVFKNKIDKLVTRFHTYLGCGHGLIDLLSHSAKWIYDSNVESVVLGIHQIYKYVKLITSHSTEIWYI